MTGPEDVRRRLAFRRALAWLALMFERLWPAVWPALGVAGLYACLAMLNVPPALPPLGQVALLGAFAAAALVLLARGLSRLRAPAPGAVDRRLERDSGLSHRPLAALADRPAASDAAGLALWQAHVARAARQITRLRVGAPHPGLAKRDRRALRGGLVVALVACAGVAGADAPARLGASLRPALPRGAPVPATELQAWITPPAYTGVAPIYLKAGTAAPSVPAGSHVTVSVTGGGPGTPSLALGGRRTQFHALDAGSFQADAALTDSVRLEVRRDGTTLAAWDVAVAPARPPVAAWTAAPGPGRAKLHTRLPWRASDEYGVTTLDAELRLAARPDAPPLIVPIPVPAGTREARGTAEQDLTGHPWAGLKVTARLVARDGAGLSGDSDAAALVLPERTFRNPQARALIAIRKGLSLHPDDRDEALAGLDTLLVAPGSIGKNVGEYINLAAIYDLLEFDSEPGAIAQAQEQLWRLALELEEGVAAKTERQLQQAREAAEKALAQMRANPNEANRAKLETALKALQQAIQQHMQALAQQLHAQGTPNAPADPGRPRLSPRDLSRMAQRALDAARQGGTEQAAQELARLERALDALRDAKPMTEAERAKAAERDAERRKGQQQISAVQDMLARQGGLLDHTEQRAREAARNGMAPLPAANPASTADQHVQNALRRALGEVMQQVGDTTGKIPEGLSQADQAMRAAAQALAAGRDEPARTAELKAIEALQKGGQETSQQMADKFGAGQDEQGGEQGGGSDFSLSDSPSGQGENGQGKGFGMNGGERGRDPLGRQAGPGGKSTDESDVAVPGQGEARRGAAIEQELRRRGAERSRSREELEYIDRLLKQF